jgi:membrane-bound lytic murein transglycosylase B
MRTLGVALALLALGVTSAFAAQPGNYAKRVEVHEFIAEMVERHGFAGRELRKLFSQARYQPAIIRAMTPPPEAPVKSWQAYRALFVSRERIEAGARFRERYDGTLARAAQEFGVPAEIVVAILGVETVYGRNMGAHRMIDALATLAFDFPRRSEFFRSELESFLLYARESGIDVLAAQGSYAGAFGIPQFMPGSYRRFAVDYDGDGRRDLNSSPVDAIGSVANFLKAHGWEAGRPIAAPAQVSGESFRKLIDVGIKPMYRIADLGAFGVGISAPLPPEAACALVELETPGQASEYWIGLQNFYALTRYNRSSFYAIAVLELAREITRAAP